MNEAVFTQMKISSFNLLPIDRLAKAANDLSEQAHNAEVAEAKSYCTRLGNAATAIGLAKFGIEAWEKAVEADLYS